MNQNTNQYMAEESIGKLMLRFSIPCIMSLLVSALYNIVDQIFIGRGIGFLGNGATNVVFPVTVIALSLSLLVGTVLQTYGLNAVYAVSVHPFPLQHLYI